MGSSFELSQQEVMNIAVASMAVGAALTAYSGVITLRSGVAWTLASAAVILVRELGQRTLAQWIDAYVDVQLSPQGAATTLVTAIFSLATQLPLVLLFPLENSFSGKRYEHWGKSIDAIWMKRQFWIVAGGTIALLLGWAASYVFDVQKLAEAFILFNFFQLMPFDYKNVPTGALDGAYLLRWSGFYWLVAMALTLVAMAFTV